jgi:membrane-bound lytic murein transglycosylase D
MANQPGIVGFAAALWLLLAAGAVTSSATDSHFLIGDPGGLEEAAVPPSDGDASDPLGESISNDVGSVTADALEQAGVTALPPPVEGPDPIAEAFAESLRLSQRPVPSRSTYPVVLNEEVQLFLDRFTGSRREIVEIWVNRSARFLEMIRAVLRKEGLPEELAYTAMIESGYNHLAVSRVGAKGMWQFMAPTARRYGLRVDRWVDERLDPEKSTIAAASYLRDLHGIFGSWMLAQAAYNAGEMKVARAIRATGSNDFWTLARSRYLKRETKDFVPQIQAATLIAQDPEKYGFEFGAEAPPPTDRVTVPAATDLRRVAAASGIPYQTLRALNPVLVRGVTPPGRTFQIAIPAGTRDSVLAAVTPRKRLVVAKKAGKSVTVSGSDAVHIVRPRETVGSIARQYGVSVKDVVRWNRLAKADPIIRPGDRLRIADLRLSAEDGQGGFR